MDNRPVGGRISETSSHPIDMNNKIMHSRSSSLCVNWMLGYMFQTYELIFRSLLEAQTT